MLKAAGRGHTKSMQTLVVDGSPVLLDALGPVIVSREGTLASISNWHEMDDEEQKLTLRRIGKRNQQRLQYLREKNAKEGFDGV